MAMGYQRQKMVLKPGDFAMQVDCRHLRPEHGPPGADDLFDTEVDSTLL